MALVITVDMKKSNINNSTAIVLGSIISYILIHYASEVITYSGNRVLYVVPYSVLIICSIFITISFSYKLIQLKIKN